MKLQTEIIALCDYATISREGKLSINGIFDELRVTNLPGGLARAFLVATVKGKPDTPYKLTIKLERGEESKTLLNMDIQTSPNGKHNMVVELVNLGFEKEGEYRFVIYHGDEEVASTLLKVIHIQEKKKEIFKTIN